MWICSMGTMGILHVSCELGLSRKGRKDGWVGLFCQISRNLYFYHRFILYGSQFL